MKTLLALALTAAVSVPVMADPYLYTGAWSKHISSEDYNETHKMLALEYRGVIGGYFENSYSEDALFAGYRFTRQWRDFEGGLMVGAVYGYRHCIKGWDESDRQICPMISPSVTYTAYPVQPSVFAVANAIGINIRTDLEVFK